MKNICTGLSLIVLVSLFCLAVPSNTFAQGGLDLPCCFDAPSGPDLGIDNGIQIENYMVPFILLDKALLTNTDLGLLQAGQFVVKSQVPLAELENSKLYVTRDREIYRKDQTRLI